MERTAEIIINHAQVRSESTIHDQRLYVGIACTGHDSDGRTHRVGYNTQVILRRTLLRVRYRSKEVADLTITERDRCTDFYSMSIIFKSQHIMAGLPEVGAYTQSIGHSRTISWTDQNGGCGSGVGNVPGAYFMFSMQVRENNGLGRNIEFIGTESI